MTAIQIENEASSGVDTRRRERNSLSLRDIDMGLGVRRAQVERLVAERNRLQDELAGARQQYRSLGKQIRSLEEEVTRKNQTLFVLRPELERLLQVQHEVKKRGEERASWLKSQHGASPRPHRAIDPKERRGHPRTPVVVNVSMVSESNFYLGFSQDVSEGGIFVATYDGIRPIGQRFPLVFTLSGREEPIFALVEVAWVREYRENEDLKHGSPGMGLRFLGLAPDDREAIARFVKQRDPFFHPEFDDLS